MSPPEIATPSRPVAGRRRACTRRAAVAVLSALVGFAILQGAAGIVINLWWPRVVDPDYGARLALVRKGRAADPAHTSTVVMLGSSRTYFDLHVEELNAPLSRELGGPVSVVNFGFMGGGPLSELLTWRRLRQDGVRPDLVLIEVLPAFLSKTFLVDDAAEARLPANRLRWRDCALLERRAPPTRPHLRRDAALGELSPLYWRRVGIVHAFAPQLLPRMENPTTYFAERLSPPPLPTHPTPEEIANAMKTARGYIPILADFQLGGRNCDTLRELLASCRREGVPAALVLMPEGPTFRGWYPPETWAQIVHWLKENGREFGAPLINAQEWLGEKEFFDSHHLLPHGAALFTERLGQEGVLPLLKREVVRTDP